MGAMRARLDTKLVRWVLPTAIALAGFVPVIIGGAVGPPLGVALWSAALVVWWAGMAARLSLSSEDEREAEERARDYFSRYGHWPDERPGPD
jgi:hypothetical protein